MQSCARLSYVQLGKEIKIMTYSPYAIEYDKESSNNQNEITGNAKPKYIRNVSLRDKAFSF